MPADKRLLLLPGDGIGPEVMGEVRRVVDWFGARRALAFEIEEGLVGGAAYDASGTALADQTLADAMAADAVILGAVGGPTWDDVPRQHRPEAGLLRQGGGAVHAPPAVAVVRDGSVIDVVTGLEVVQRAT